LYCPALVRKDFLVSLLDHPVFFILSIIARKFDGSAPLFVQRISVLRMRSPRGRRDPSFGSSSVEKSDTTINGRADHGDRLLFVGEGRGRSLGPCTPRRWPKPRGCCFRVCASVWFEMLSCSCLDQLVLVRLNDSGLAEVCRMDVLQLCSRAEDRGR